MKCTIFNLTFSVLILFSFTLRVNSQAFDNKTRALYILDISKYVEWPADYFLPLKSFTIGILDSQEELFWDIYNLGKTRKYIQGKPIEIYLFKEISQIKPTNVLYINKLNNYKLEPIIKILSGRHTLLITEGYEFRESMLNFIVTGNKPSFEVNEELMLKERLKVNELFLAQAVKTREDWEKLFQVTDTMLQAEKEVTMQQRLIIKEQEQKINEQAEMIKLQMIKLDSLDNEIRNKQRTIIQKENILLTQEKEINQQKGLIEKQVMEVQNQKKILADQQKEIDDRVKDIRAKELIITEQDSRINDQIKQIEKQKLITYFVVVALILVSGIGYFIYINYRNKKKANQILEEKNRLITAQKDEIKQQKDIAEMQRDQIAYQKKHITDSIHYALRIQRALLPSLELFSDEIDHFVIYRPRDIVSGDFYWVNKIDNIWVVIAADCTGHGVPGAFMSMLGISFLNEIVLNKRILRPDLILNHLRENVIRSLKQLDNQSNVKDGMDIAICTVDYDLNVLKFAGANNPLFLLQKGELQQIKGDKMPVAVHEIMDPFTLHTFDLNKGDVFYLYSDGFIDQFGGPNQKKFLTKNFKEAILTLKDKSMYDQGLALNQIFEDWKKEIDQVDDVILIGMRY